MTIGISQLVQQQRAFFQSGVTRPAGFRRAQLRKLGAAIDAQESLLADALQADLRKSPYNAFISEVGLVQSELRYAVRHLSGWGKRKSRPAPLIAWPARGFVRPEPYGVSLIVGAWNYPFQLLFAPLVGALAAGNCAVLKTSECAPRTAEAIDRLVKQTFPPEYVGVVNGGPDVAEELLREQFDKIFFTGSSRVGRMVMAAAARHLTPITLELGGKCPCLVCADAPLEITARRVAWGKFTNAGQTCVAPDFVLVERTVREPFIAALIRAVRQFYGDDPQQSPDYGRIVNRAHWDRLVGGLGDGRIVHGGQRAADDLYLAPTILADVPVDSPIMQDEIFGPVLPIIEYDRLEDALARLRNRPTPLALYLFTRDSSVQDRVLDEVRSGGVCINDTVLHMLGKQLPFGGMGSSGFGAYHGKASFDCFTHYRSVMRQAFFGDSALRYPPQRLSLATMRRVFRFLLGG